ncbi:ribonuclease III [Ilumatobacter sp.]|uniref:ribonuclease III n=1 Tax=Ilumatobacter sp. TaxID=1967498 RepID=UPI003C36A6CB
MDLDDLSARIGYRFERADLLERSLAHRSWCAENDGADSNERLEFLGDAVLGWAIADITYRRFDDLSEGRLTDLRKSVVNAHALAEVADEIGLGPFIKLGRGESAAGGAEKHSILSDVFEAVLGAVYLDGGPDAAFAFVERHVATRLATTIDGLGHLDWKTELQERCARHGRPAPEYTLTSTGPDHAKSFTATVAVGDDVLGSGEGTSKKAAEQVAAHAACRVLD